jgi:5-methylcytosine-specific restriction protein A
VPDMPAPFKGSGGGRVERRRTYDADRVKAKPWRNWYKLAAWLRRREDQLRNEPLCRRCDMQGRITAATVANHVKPHRGNWDLFINGKLESACKPCHDSVIQSEERKANGRPD